MNEMNIESILPPKELVETVLDRDVKDLPAFPVVAMKIMALIKQDNVSAVDIAKVIESDPAVTAKILRMVNSASYGLRSRVSSVKEGITLLGLSAIQRLALQVTLFEQIIRPQKAVIFDRNFFWQHCLAVAGLSLALAEETRYPRPEEAYVAGLLHDIGKTILDGYGCISYGDFLKNLIEPDNLKIEAEKKVIGISHDDIGVYYCASWNLPDALLHAVKFHHQRFGHLGLPDDNGKLVAIVCLSNFLAWTQGLGSADILRHPVLLPEVETHIDLNTINLAVLMDRMDQEIKRTAELYRFTFPSPNQLRMNLLRANIELARLNTTYHYSSHNELKPSIKSMDTSIPSTVTGSELLIKKTMNAIQEDFGYDRLFILKIDRDKRCLVPVYIFDFAKKGDDLSLIKLFIAKKSTKIIDCLRQLRPVIIKYESQEESLILELFKTQEIGFIPFSHSNRLQGLVGVDNYNSRISIDISDLSRLCSVAQELGVAFDQSVNTQSANLKECIDPLTKLYSHNYMVDKLSSLFREKDLTADKFFLGIIEIDSIKEFNNQFGFLEGESVTKLVAGILNKISRSTDETGRYETESFMVILNHMTLEKAVLFAERLRAKIEKLGELLLKRFPGHIVTVSIVMAALVPEMRSETQMIMAAKKALIEAQKSGGNRVVILQKAE